MDKRILATNLDNVRRRLASAASIDDWQQARHEIERAARELQKVINQLRQA